MPFIPAALPLPPSRVPSPTSPGGGGTTGGAPSLKRHVSTASPLRASSVPPIHASPGDHVKEDPIQDLLFSSRPSSRTASPAASPHRFTSSSRQRPMITRSTTSTTTIVHPASTSASVPLPSLGKRHFAGDRARDGATSEQDDEWGETNEEDDFYLERCESG